MKNAVEKVNDLLGVRVEHHGSEATSVLGEMILACDLTRRKKRRKDAQPADPGRIDRRQVQDPPPSRIKITKPIKKPSSTWSIIQDDANATILKMFKSDIISDSRLQGENETMEIMHIELNVHDEPRSIVFYMPVTRCKELELKVGMRVKYEIHVHEN